MLLLLCNIGYFNVAIAQVPAQRTIIVESPPPPFEANEDALQILFEQFQELMTCKESFAKQSACFFSEEDIRNYITLLEKQDYPEITQKVSPLFVQMVQQAKEYLQDHCTNVSHAELLGTEQKIGTTDAMKKITAYINLHYHDKTIKTVRLLLLDFDGIYKIVAIDS